MNDLYCYIKHCMLSQREQFLIIAFMLFFLHQPLKANIKVERLTCQNMSLAIGVDKPSFGWQLITDKRDVYQKAWQIQISSSKPINQQNQPDIWDSGKVYSEKMFGIMPDYIDFKSGRTYWWRVKVWTNSGYCTSWSTPSCFTMGILKESDWKALWVTAESDEKINLPYIKKEFDLFADKPMDVHIDQALVFLSGLGSSDLFVNGLYADSTRILDPAQTDYEHSILYSTFNITSLLKQSSKNCIGVTLNNGWFNQDKVFSKQSSYSKPMVRLQLQVTYSDGTCRVLGTDESWYWHEGPVVYSNIYNGEIYDARQEIEDWCKPGSSIKNWKKVSEIKGFRPGVMLSQIIPPIRSHQALAAKNCWKTNSGTWIYDFGENNTANIKLKINLPRDTHIVVTTSEEITPDSCMDYRSTGIHVAGKQTDEYICRGGGVEIWMPRTTYHGFRYVELSFSDSSIIPQKDWVEAVLVHTDLSVTGRFECSDSQINKLHEMALRTVSGNIQGVPIDCPHREKCGWLGDVHAYIKMACFNYDILNFMHKYMNDIYTTSQGEEKNALCHLDNLVRFYYADKPSGLPYQIAPGRRLCGVASPEWGTALVQIPWYIYLYYGDTSLFEKYYDFMKQWVDYVDGLAIDNIVYYGMGDWCPPMGRPGIDTPLEFTSTGFHYYEVSIMSKVASVLGRSSDQIYYSSKASLIKEAIQKKFYNPVAHTFGSQTADAMALDFNLCPEGDKEKVAKALALRIKAKNGFFYTGIFGLNRIGSALSRNGQPELAWKTFTKKGDYSFAWMWDKYNATTLWEILPICDANATITAKQSHSHPMQAGFDVWFYEDLAGIRPVEKEPGFKTILFDPLWQVDLEWVRAEFQSRYGLVSSSWKKKDTVIKWDINIPSGSSGCVALPSGFDIVDKNTETSIKNIYMFEYSDGRKDFYRLPAGSYNLLIKKIDNK